MDAKLEVDQMMKDLYAKGVKVVYKEGRWWSFLAWLVMVLSFGQNKSFKNYVTTIWKTIAVPKDLWDRWPAVVQLEVLTHEAKHVEQFRKWTPPLFALLYLLFPLPLGLAWFRYKMERDAYAAGFAVSIRYKAANRAALIEFAANELSGAGYIWAWPFKNNIRKWFEENLPHE